MFSSQGKDPLSVMVQMTRSLSKTVEVKVSQYLCTDGGCSLIRDKSTEICSVAISKRSLDLADSVIRLKGDI